MRPRGRQGQRNGFHHTASGRRRVLLTTGMASIGHIAVGMAAARLQSPRAASRALLAISMVAWSLLSLLPDVDVVGFRFGVRYTDAWGHRGASHSFAFSLALAAIVAAAASLLRLRPIRTGLFAFAVVASHAVLDTMTDGGLGCALWWPWSAERHFAPWTPIPVAPIGRRFFTGAGLAVAVYEMILFAPVLLYAVWPRRGSPRRGVDAGSRASRRSSGILLSAVAGVALVACSQPASLRPIGVFPPAGDLEMLFVRTDFADDRAWHVLLADAMSFHEGFRAEIRPVDDRRFEGLTVERLMELVPQGQEPFYIFLVDRDALTRADRAVRVVNLYEPRGASFRVIPAHLWSVQANLSLANMDWEEFAGALDADGVFRGFSRGDEAARR